MTTLPLRLYAAPASVSIVSNAAELIVPRSGHIIALVAQIMSIPASGDTPLRMQCSLQSVEQFTQNDPGGVLLDVIAYYDYAASSASSIINFVSQQINSIRVSVVAGQKIYLHTDAATTSDTFHANVYLEI